MDDLVEAVVTELERQHLLNSTYVFYSSDHGFHMGHMRLGFGKSHHYEFDTRVPMMARTWGVGLARRWLVCETDVLV